MQRRLVSLALAALWLPISGAAAANSNCPDAVATTGRYQNFSYGFTVVIPRGLEGRWNSAVCAPGPSGGCVCMGDHGRDLPLAGGGVISLFADPSLEGSLPTAAYRDLQAFESHTDPSELEIRQLQPLRVRAMPGYRYVAASLEAQAPVIREATWVALPSGSFVVLSIEAPESQFRKYHGAYVAILHSLRPSPRR